MTPDLPPIQISVKSDAATETTGWGTLKLPDNFFELEQRLHIDALEILGCWYH
jgi:hypothetical protein